ncbi:MAG: GGDEF domain-containing protein [Pseudomonadota bacterium]
MRISSVLNRSIGTRALLRGAILIGIGTILTAVMAMWWFDSRAHQIRVDGLEATAKIIADGTANSIRDDLITRNYAGLESRLKQTISDDRVLSILVADEDGRVLSQIKRAPDSHKVEFVYSSQLIKAPSQAFEVRTDGFITTQWLRLDAGVPIGWLKLEIGSTDVDDALIDLRRHVAIWLLSACTVLLLALAIVLRRTYSLLRLEEKTREIKHQVLEHVAYHDSLTGLPNRHLLLDRINQALAYSERNLKKFAVCFGDLDGFKLVNDHYGHDAGDHVLKEVGSRLKQCVRANDTVARLGGDEFVVLLMDIELNSEFEMVLDRILSEVKRPIELPNGDVVSVALSMGITIFPDDPSSPSILIEHADQAMYEIKRSRKGCWFIRPFE